MRGRGGRKGGGGSSANRSYESNGPDVKVRGTAAHIAEKYVQLARDAASAGDPVASENYLQHAEHYFRIVAASQPPEQRGYASSLDNDSDEEGEEAGFGHGGNGHHNNGHANGHVAGRGEQPSEIVERSRGNAEPEEAGDAGPEAVETAAPARSRRPRRPARDASERGGQGEDVNTAARPDEDKAGAAALEA